MARADAVRAVNPALFDRGWSKVSGSASGGLGKRAQMIRAARGHSPAMEAVLVHREVNGLRTESLFETDLPYLAGAAPQPAFAL